MNCKPANERPVFFVAVELWVKMTSCHLLRSIITSLSLSPLSVNIILVLVGSVKDMIILRLFWFLCAFKTTQVNPVNVYFVALFEMKIFTVYLYKDALRAETSYG